MIGTNYMIKDVLPSQYSELLDVQIGCIHSLDATYNQEEINTWVGYLERATPQRFADFQNRAWFTDMGSIEGFVSWSQDELSGLASVECLYVREASRGQNIGRLLLHVAEDNFTAATRILVRSTLNAQPFYEKNGYVLKELGKSRAGFDIAILEKTVIL